tara:strand:+ start:908 stop:4282 length:3375 start_codon:yes stop_codon:yes gene_type:complete
VNKLEQAVEEYFTKLQTLKSTGGATSETSYYSALEGLLNAIGKSLKPKVFCVSQLADQGAGHPDFGLYTANQCQKGEPKPGQKPERGVIEVKGTSDETLLTAETNQVSKYWSAYRLVLVTNYRDFLLVGENAAGHATKLESFRLANTEPEFWSRTLTPRKYAQEVGQSFGEYLKRALTQSVSLREPRDVAWFLASYARDALNRVEEKGDVPALQSVRTALEDALGVRFSGDKGEHFFQSTLVQTLFYGVFSAWVLWSRQLPPPTGAFDWRSAVWHLRVPMLQALFQQVSDPTKLKALDLVELLDWAGAALNRIDRKEFFSRFKDAEAVQYFYEPFLDAFDPALRKELGVWYTPPEVVTYMVARVDKALKEDLGIEDGLAADNVYILDPCTGTGSYLAETLRKISENLEDKGLGGLKGSMVKKAATERVFGFEIMPAPFVVAHLQIGLVLQSLQAPLADDGSERASVYLTNALTGWEPTDKEKQHVAFPEMEEERDRANEVKREKPILVILGNPPYNGFAGMAMDEERNLSDAYRTVKNVRKPDGQGLNDLYVRFFRMAERRITEKTGQGIICFISNYSWLDGLSFTGMRERYLDVFDAIRIDNLNGDAYRTGKVAPDGSPDPSIFSTEHNREGIQVGTAITTLVRKQQSMPSNQVEVRNLWGQNKHQALLDSTGISSEKLYEELEPIMALGLPYLATAVSTTYFDWPSLSELLPASFAGVKTSRDEFLIDVDEQALHDRIADYFNTSIPDDLIKERYPSILNNLGRFDGPATRMKLKARGISPGKFVRYLYRPLDVRWLYWEPDTKLLDEKRSGYFPHIFEGNIWIEAREKQSKEDFNRGTVTSVLADNFGSGLSTYFPAYIRETHSNGENVPIEKRPNLLKSVEDKLTGLGLGVDDLFHHIVSILHSPKYREENAGALRMDWPRVPFVENAEVLKVSAVLGHQLAALMDPEKPVSGVTTSVRAELKTLGVPSKVAGGDLMANDFALAAGWGSTQKGGVVMPGRGKSISRDYTPEEIAAFGAGSGPLSMTPSQITELLGSDTLDIYLNADAYWRNVPAKVWTYKLGGYQVIKKWLSYREKDILGRSLKLEEVQEVTNMIRRIAAILLLSPELDANYKAVKTAAE